MKLLILGGTIFLGRHLVTAAQARGHAVTLFNRGQHNADLFPEVEKLRGDRGAPEGLAALAGRRWDAVIDTCGYHPQAVRATAGALAEAVDHYTFVSTVSVYADTRRPGIDEAYPVGQIADEAAPVSNETYGPYKARCEQAAEAALPGRVLHARPGLIVGPYDPSDRFTYWPVRVARGGQVLAPERPGYGVQIIDGRDLAEWLIRQAEARTTGVFNLTGPAQPLTLGEVLAAARAASGSEAEFVWASEAFLSAEQVGAWIELPLWIPASDPDAAGFSAIDCRKALQAGLTFRPLAETVRDTLAWAATRPADHAWRAGLTPEREAELLARWQAQG